MKTAMEKTLRQGILCRLAANHTQIRKNVSHWEERSFMDITSLKGKKGRTV